MLGLASEVGASVPPASALAVVLVLGAAVTADLAVVAVWRAVLERSWPFRSPETVVDVRVGAAEPGGPPPERSGSRGRRSRKWRRRSNAPTRSPGSATTPSRMPWSSTVRTALRISLRHADQDGRGDSQVADESLHRSVSGAASDGPHISRMYWFSWDSPLAGSGTPIR